MVPPAEEDRSAIVWIKRFHRALGINLTMTCPLRCAHCCVDASPHRNEKLEGTWIVQRLREVGGHGQIEQLVISGGEPFLRAGLLREILQVANGQGIRALVHTSAYWAKSPEKAAEFLEGFPGLTHLCISADEYHEPFVPLEYVRYGLLASLGHGLVTELAVRVWDTVSDPFLDRLEAVLGPELLEQVHVDLSPIGWVGRARSLAPPRAGVAPPETVAGFPAGACDTAHLPIVDHDGSVLACCNTELARKNRPLQLGNLQDEPFEAITARAQRNNLLHAIRLWGPAQLAEILIEHGQADALQGVYPAGDICALCNDILSQPRLVELLERVLASPTYQAEIMLARLWRFGETVPGSTDLEDQDSGNEVAVRRVG
jgi:hypothetical protein